MRTCPDLCDEVVRRLKKLGFHFDETEDHEQIFSALADVHFAVSYPDFKFVILTLRYCLETFEQNCQCGQCDPCRRGQDDIRQAIQTIEDLRRPVPSIATKPDLQISRDK